MSRDPEYEDYIKLTDSISKTELSTNEYTLHLLVIESLQKKWHPCLEKNISLVAGISTIALNMMIWNNELKLKERHSIYHLFLTKGKTKLSQMEIMAKNLVYRELKVNTIFFTKSTLYQVIHVVATDKGFLGVLFFEHFGDRWIFVVKGSGFTFEEIDAASSYCTDLEWSLGNSAWNSAREFVSKMIKDFKITSLTLCGHSLGAVIVQMMTSELYPTVDKVYLFNGPGATQRTHDIFKAKTEKYFSRIDIYCFITEGDYVHMMNGYYLGYNIPHANLTLTVFKIEDLIYPDLSFGIIPHTYLPITNPRSRRITAITRKTFDWGPSDKDDDGDIETPETQKFIESSIFSEYCAQYSPALEFLRAGSGILLSNLFAIHRFAWRLIVPSRILTYKYENENTIVQIDQSINEI